VLSELLPALHFCSSPANCRSVASSGDFAGGPCKLVFRSTLGGVTFALRLSMSVQYFWLYAALLTAWSAWSGRCSC